MAYLRTPDTGGIGETYLDIIVQDLQYTPGAYDRIDLFCLETGQGYDVRFNSGAGGTSGTYRTGAQRFPGLTPGAYYNFYAETTYAGGSRRIPDSGYYQQRTLVGQTVDPPAGLSVSVYSVVGKDVTIDVTWYGQANKVDYDVSWISGYPNYTDTVSTSSSFRRRTFTVPDYDMPYWIDVLLTGPGGSSSWVTVFFQSDPAPVVVGQAVITSLSNYKKDAITVNWASADNAWYYEVQYKKSTTSTWTYAAYSQNGNSFEVSGLDPATDYDFRVRGYQGSAYGSWSSSMRGHTLSNIPTEFNWNFPKVQGEEFYLTANEWNALAAKINQFREYKFGPGYDYSFTTAIQGAIFYAYMANEARNAMDALGPEVSPPALRYTDDPVEASILNRLRDSLNSVT